MSEIAARMRHTTAAATGLVDRLETFGYVVRAHATDDRRKVLVHITPCGSELVGRIKDDMIHNLNTTMTHLTRRRTARVVAGLPQGPACCPSTAIQRESHEEPPFRRGPHGRRLPSLSPPACCRPPPVAVRTLPAGAAPVDANLAIPPQPPHARRRHRHRVASQSADSPVSCRRSSGSRACLSRSAPPRCRTSSAAARSSRPTDQSAGFRGVRNGQHRHRRADRPRHRGRPARGREPPAPATTYHRHRDEHQQPELPHPRTAPPTPPTTTTFLPFSSLFGSGNETINDKSYTVTCRGPADALQRRHPAARSGRRAFCATPPTTLCARRWTRRSTP